MTRSTTTTDKTMDVRFFATEWAGFLILRALPLGPQCAIAFPKLADAVCAEVDVATVHDDASRVDIVTHLAPSLHLVLPESLELIDALDVFLLERRKLGASAHVLLDEVNGRETSKGRRDPKNAVPRPEGHQLIAEEQASTCFEDRHGSHKDNDVHKDQLHEHWGVFRDAGASKVQCEVVCFHFHGVRPERVEVAEDWWTDTQAFRWVLDRLGKPGAEEVLRKGELVLFDFDFSEHVDDELQGFGRRAGSFDWFS